MFDAYNIRKIAPRMLLAVIGVNLSIYLCVAAVDVINVIGGGLGALLRGPFLDSGGFGPASVGAGESAGGAIASGSIVGLVGGYSISGLVSAGTSVAGSVGFLGALKAGAISLVTQAGPFILIALLLLVIGAVLIALAIMATVIIRFGAIILLTLVSPIAISMLVLPGTEKYFRKWWEYFIKTLMVYPIIAAIFAVSDVMAAIFLKTQAGDDGITEIATIFVVIVVVYAPLFMIPFSFKLAGGFLGSVYDFANKNMYGRAKPRMDKWKEKEGGYYQKKKDKADRALDRAGFTPESAASRAGSLFRGLNKESRARNRERREKERQEREEAKRLADKVNNQTATDQEINRLLELSNQGYNVDDEGNVTGPKTRGVFREALAAANNEGARRHASEVRQAATKAEEDDTDVKDIQGIDDVGKAIRALIDHGLHGASEALRHSNPFQYDYTEAGISTGEQQKRKASHDQVLDQMQRLQGRYGDDVVESIGARQDARAATGSDALAMREDALKMAGAKAVNTELDDKGISRVTEWDTTGMDAVAFNRNLDDLRNFAKEAGRLDKAGVGFSEDIKQTMALVNGSDSAKSVKQNLLRGALKKNSASQIATMHDKGVEEMKNVLTERANEAMQTGNDGEYQRAMAEVANLYDAFQYAAPKNLDTLNDIMGQQGKEGTFLDEVEKMRGQRSKYTEFAKYRRDFSQEERYAKDAATSEGGGMPGSGMPG